MGFCVITWGVILDPEEFGQTRARVVLKFFVGSITLCCIFVVSSFVRVKEESAVTKLARDHLQKIWAASFAARRSSSADSPGEARLADYDTRKLFILGFSYLILTPCTFALVPLYIKAATEGSMLKEWSKLNTVLWNLLFVPFNAYDETGKMTHLILSVTLSVYAWLCMEMIARDLVLVVILFRAYCLSNELPNDQDDGSDLDAAIDNGADPRFTWTTSIGLAFAVIVSAAAAAGSTTLLVVNIRRWRNEDVHTPGHGDTPVMLFLLGIFVLVAVYFAVGFIAWLVAVHVERYTFWKRLNKSKVRGVPQSANEEGDSLDQLTPATGGQVC
jgi:hypothetical protein